MEQPNQFPNRRRKSRVIPFGYKQSETDDKILELTLLYRHLFIISKYNVFKGKIIAGNKLDNESIRDYFRREDKLV